MNPEVRNDFLVELRSGRRKQTKGVLSEVISGEDCYCALGVLADLAVAAGVATKKFIPSEGMGRFTRPFYSFDGRGSYLSEAIQEWAGLTTLEAAAIQRMNDLRELNFEQIANWVEENL